MIVTISKGQQITIPADIRNEFGWDIGSKIEIEQKEGRIILKPIGEDLDKIFERAKKIKPKHRLTVKQMDDLNEKIFK